MHIVPITQNNAHIFEVFAQDYEAEFSALTRKEPNASGRFSLEATWQDPYKGFYQFINETPTGFVVVGIVEGRFDIAEFYILPCYRKKGLGKTLAYKMFDTFPGLWQVRQIKEATGARLFWRNVIDAYTGGHFTEDQVEDSHWGIVWRQLFNSSS